MVADRPGEDFAGARRVAVDEQHQRHPPGAAAGRGVVEVFLGAAAPGGHHQAAINEQVGHFDRRRQEPAGIAPQVEHQRPHPRPVQPAEGRLEIGGGRLLKRGQPDPGDSCSLVDDRRILDARHLDVLAADRHRPRCAGPADDGQGHQRALWPLEEVSRLVDTQASDRAAADADQVVAGPDSRPFRGTARDDMHHEQAIAGALEFDAETDEVAFDLGVEILQLPRRQEGRVFVEPADGRGGHLHQRDRRRYAED